MATSLHPTLRACERMAYILHDVGSMTSYALSALMFLSPAPVNQAQAATQAPDLSMSTDAIRKGTREAFIFGYPLVLMDVSREVMTGPGRMSAPINTFFHMRGFPTPSFTDVVSPNADTLYSSAWLDLSKEPVVLSLPSSGERYYVMQLLDAWTNVFASPGPRTTGNQKGDYAIVGPNWRGALPDGVREIRSPTNLAWIIGRTQTDGTADYPAVHAMQDAYRLTPLSTFVKSGPRPNPPDRPLTQANAPSPAEQVARMDAVTFFNRLAKLLPKNPAAPADRAMMSQLRSLGVVPGEVFAPTAAQRSLMTLAIRDAEANLRSQAKRQSDLVNGWSIERHLGSYATDYDKRALIALVGLGANLPEDAIYPRATVDEEGRPLSGRHRYVLHFDKDEIPPVKAFWSVTLYDDKQAFVQNPLGRYALGDRDDLTFNPDGSLDLYIQATPPGGDKQANWLPAPKGAFNLIMRLYWPEQPVLNGRWRPPSVERLEPGERT